MVTVCNVSTYTATDSRSFGWCINCLCFPSPFLGPSVMGLCHVMWPFYSCKFVGWCMRVRLCVCECTVHMSFLFPPPQTYMTLDKALPDTDVLYMTRLQKERFSSAREYDKVRGQEGFSLFMFHMIFHVYTERARDVYENCTATYTNCQSQCLVCHRWDVSCCCHGSCEGVMSWLRKSWQGPRRRWSFFTLSLGSTKSGGISILLSIYSHPLKLMRTVWFVVCIQNVFFLFVWHLFEKWMSMLNLKLNFCHLCWLVFPLTVVPCTALHLASWNQEFDITL